MLLCTLRIAHLDSLDQEYILAMLSLGWEQAGRYYRLQPNIISYEAAQLPIKRSALMKAKKARYRTPYVAGKSFSFAPVVAIILNPFSKSPAQEVATLNL
eukprot:4900447-Pleurochrysis_carterae.AAC.2